MDKTSVAITTRIKLLAQSTNEFASIIASTAAAIADAAHGLKIDGSQFAVALGHMLSARVALDTALRIGGNIPASGDATRRRVEMLGDTQLSDDAQFALDDTTKAFLKTTSQQLATLGAHIIQNARNTDIGRIVATLDALLLASHVFAGAAVLGNALHQKRRNAADAEIGGDESSSTSPERRDAKTRRISAISSQ